MEGIVEIETCPDEFIIRTSFSVIKPKKDNGENRISPDWNEFIGKQVIGIPDKSQAIEEIEQEIGSKDADTFESVSRPCSVCFVKSGKFNSAFPCLFPQSCLIGFTEEEDEQEEDDTKWSPIRLE